jgi:hypothetical protein
MYTNDDDDVSGDLSSAFLKQSDFDRDQAIVFTILRVEKKQFEAKNGRPAESKWVVTFDGERCLSLNKTNLALLAKWFGKKAGAWKGKKITVYRDESISFGGRLVGGLRVRKPAPQDVPAFVTETDDPFEDDSEQEVIR